MTAQTGIFTALLVAPYLVLQGVVHAFVTQDTAVQVVQQLRHALAHQIQMMTAVMQISTASTVVMLAALLGRALALGATLVSLAQTVQTQFVVPIHVKMVALAQIMVISLTLATAWLVTPVLTVKLILMIVQRLRARTVARVSMV